MASATGSTTESGSCAIATSSPKLVLLGGPLAFPLLEQRLQALAHQQARNP